MEYHTAAKAKDKAGLRITLTAGVPAPWSESAKAVLKVKGIPYVPVLQKAAGHNEDLVEWTGHRNAPTVMYEDEPARVTWLDILNLVERLQPEPPLVPDNMEDRILMTGLMNELAGEGGMLWSTRTLMFHVMAQSAGEDAVAENPMFRNYRYSPEAAATASHRAIEVLRRLEQQLQKQSSVGSRFFIADRLSVLDLYWACFSQTLDPLPHEVNPMPDSLRSTWGLGTEIMAKDGYSPDACLFEHRDFIFAEYIGLPLDF